MVTKRDGFTLIDFILVVDIMAIMAVMAIPSPLPAPPVSNEANAKAVLGRLLHAQVKFQPAGYMDEDQDGRGEYGSFGELSGLSNLIRNGVGTPAPLKRPLLPPSFQTISINGYASNAGYLFVLFLPTNAASPNGLPDIAGGGPNAAVDPDKCEMYWCAYAWPVVAGVTGNRAFFVNQGGTVLASEMSSVVYSGAAAAPSYSAAFMAASMAAPIAVPPNVGVDGNSWLISP